MFCVYKLYKASWTFWKFEYIGFCKSRKEGYNSLLQSMVQAWWVAVRENLLVLGSGSVVGAGITVAAQDADTPLPVQVGLVPD